MVYTSILMNCGKKHPTLSELFLFFYCFFSNSISTILYVLTVAVTFLLIQCHGTSDQKRLLMIILVKPLYNGFALSRGLGICRKRRNFEPSARFSCCSGKNKFLAYFWLFVCRVESTMPDINSGLF